MDSKWGRTATKRPHWKGFGVGRTALSCRDSSDMEHGCRIRAILPYCYRNRNRNQNHILNPWFSQQAIVPQFVKWPLLDAKYTLTKIFHLFYMLAQVKIYHPLYLIRLENSNITPFLLTHRIGLQGISWFGKTSRGNILPNSKYLRRELNFQLSW